MIEEQTVKPFVTILYDDRLQYYTVPYNTIRHDTEKFNTIWYDIIYRYENCNENFQTLQYLYDAIWYDMIK